MVVKVVGAPGQNLKIKVFSISHSRIWGPSEPSKTQCDFRIYPGSTPHFDHQPHSSDTVMHHVYYCPVCGKKECDQLGAVCLGCRMTAGMQRGPSVPAQIEGHCFYCREHRYVIVTDHVVPIIRGGPDAPWNKVRCCEICNLGKSDMLPSEWCPNHVEALAIQAKVSTILPRMRRGRLLNNEKQAHFAVFAACTSFSTTLLELWSNMPANSSGRGRPQVKPMIYTLWRKVDAIRVHLIDHPLVLQARDADRW